MNLQIVNGFGGTNGTPDDPDALTSLRNGVGNLIVGYNELGNPNGDDRTGSHNIVVGSQNQLEDFGVWAIEFDFGIKDGRLLVAHLGSSSLLSGADETWGKYLGSYEGNEGYFERIASTFIFEYRPIIIYLEKKDWDDVDPCDPEECEPGWCPLLEEALIDAFGVDHIFGPLRYAENGYTWPTVPDLAGMVIPIMLDGVGRLYCNNDDDESNDAGEIVESDWIFKNSEGLKRKNVDSCSSAEEMVDFVNNDDPNDPIVVLGCRSVSV